MAAYSSLLTSTDDLQCLMCAEQPSGALVILSMDRMDRESLKFYSHYLILWKIRTHSHTHTCVWVCLAAPVLRPALHPSPPSHRFCLGSAKLPLLGSSWTPSKRSGHICWVLGEVADAGVTTRDPTGHICDSRPCPVRCSALRKWTFSGAAGTPEPEGSNLSSPSRSMWDHRCVSISQLVCLSFPLVERNCLEPYIEIFEGIRDMYQWSYFCVSLVVVISILHIFYFILVQKSVFSESFVVCKAHNSNCHFLNYFSWQTPESTRCTIWVNCLKIYIVI